MNLAVPSSATQLVTWDYIKTNCDSPEYRNSSGRARALAGDAVAQIRWHDVGR